MTKFNEHVEQLLKEYAANVAGGTGSVTGPSTAGNTAGQFPASGDQGYNPGSALLAAPLGMKKPYKVYKNKPAKKRSVRVQRRQFSGL